MGALISRSFGIASTSAALQPRSAAVSIRSCSRHAGTAEVRLYDRHFNIANLQDVPEGMKDSDFMNPDSLQVLPAAMVESCVLDLPAGSGFQFERTGYFCIDTKDSRPGAVVINRTVTLKDTWAKMTQKG